MTKDRSPFHPLSVWRRIPPPRRHRVILALRYLVYIVVGILTILSPPEYLLEGIGASASRSWGALVLAGGVVGAVFVFLYELLWERAAILALGGCLFLYGFVTLDRGVFDMGEARWITLGLVALACFDLIDRYLEIYKFDVEPGH